MRIVHLTVKHAADDVRIYCKEAASAAAVGHDVVVVAPPPEPRFIADGVTWIAGPSYAPPSRRPLAARAMLAEMAHLALSVRPDLIQFHDPELIPVARRLARRGLRIVYDVHEDYAGVALGDPAKPRYWRAAKAATWRLLEARARRFCAGFVAATPAIARKFPPARTVCVQNFPLALEIASSAPLRPFAERDREVIFVGGLNVVRGAAVMLETLAQLTGSVRMLLAGALTEPSEQAVLRAMPGWAFVEDLGWLPRQSVQSIMAARPRAAIVVFQPAPNHIEAQPNKLFEYMAAGLPVIASDFPLWRDIIASANCGLLVNPRDPAAIAAAMRRLLDNPAEAEAMGRRGRAAVESRYSWTTEAQTLLAFYERLTA